MHNILSLLKKTGLSSILVFLSLHPVKTGAAETLSSTKASNTIPASAPQPAIFPFGIWHANDFLGNFCCAMEEPLTTREKKIFHDFAKHNINVVLPTISGCVDREYLDMASAYGMRIVSNYSPLEALSHESLVASREEDLAPVKLKIMEYMQKVKDHPALLAYNVYGEPHPDRCVSIKKITDFMRSIDARHPATYVQQSLPLGNFKSEWDVLGSLEVIFSDCYSFNTAFGRDPWIFGDIAMREFYRVNPKASYWPIIQSYRYMYKPAIGELRVNVYHTIACGAKGIFLYTTGQAGVTWPTPPSPRLLQMWESPGTVWFSENELLAELGEIGYHLTSAGPLLIPLAFSPDYKHEVKCQTYETKIIGTLNLRTAVDYLPGKNDVKFPVIGLGAFVGPDYDILVIHNDDPNIERTGEITVPVSPGKDSLFDLYTLKKVPTVKTKDGRLSFSLSLGDGEGRLYLLGNEKSFNEAQKTVRRNRLNHETLLLGLDLEIAKKGGVDATAVEEKIALANKMSAAGQLEDAVNALEDARKNFIVAEASTIKYWEMKNDLDNMRSHFDRIDYRLKKLTFYEMYRQPARTWDEVDPNTQALIKSTLDLTKQFGQMENDFREGKINLDKGKKLLRDVIALDAEISHL